MRKGRFLPPVRINGVLAQGGDFEALFRTFQFSYFLVFHFGAVLGGSWGDLASLVLTAGRAASNSTG